MAKRVYKIPASLDAGYLTMNINLANKDGSISHIFTVKKLLAYLLSIFGLVYMLFESFVAQGTVAQKIIFTVVWVLWTVLLVKNDKTGRLQIQMIPSLLTYIPKKARQIYTRKTNKADSFFGICGQSDEVGKKGLISFNDGTYGYMYRVVGSASILLFDDDKTAILNRVDNFYRKLTTDVELVWITTKEPQKVFHQVSHLKKLYDNLDDSEPELKELVNTEFRVLRDEVGGAYKSIHQYLVLKANNKEALLRGRAIIQSEVENSSLMIKQCVPLVNKKDIDEVFCKIYQKE